MLNGCSFGAQLSSAFSHSESQGHASATFTEETGSKVFEREMNEKQTQTHSRIEVELTGGSFEWSIVDPMGTCAGKVGPREMKA